MNTKQHFNPYYDPLRDTIPGIHSEYSTSYWVANVDTLPANDGIAEGTITTDVAIIGGGFTGLATAMFLAKEYGIKATILEANQVAWGCTSRNGGQGHLAWGRMSRSAWARKWGTKVAQTIHHNTLEAFEVFRHFAYSEEIDCEPFGEGNILIAHNNSSFSALKKESEFCNTVLGYPTKIINRQELHRTYIKDYEALGALVEPVGIAVQPFKLALGYMKIAQKYGAKVYVGSPVINWHTEHNVHRLLTPNAEVFAKKVVIATAGYTHKSLHPVISYRTMPIMANSAVTEVLTDEQIKRAGLNSHLYCTDSRKLRYYYRFLPDNRLQIGTRSAISGADNNNTKHLQNVKNAIAKKFPALANVKIEYFCSGWMDISHDMMPRICKPDSNEEIYYAGGYSGNGVAFSVYAAKKLSELITGKADTINNLPIFTSPLPTHPLRILRRTGQRLLFKYYNAIDRLG